MKRSRAAEFLRAKARQHAKVNQEMNPENVKITTRIKTLETDWVRFPFTGASTTNRAPSNDVRRVVQAAFARALRAQRGL